MRKPPLELAFLTAGDPGSITGGHLYNRRMIDRAAGHGWRILLQALPSSGLRGFLSGPALARRALRGRPDAVMVDSLAAAALAPLIPALRRSRPVLAIVHQKPGGVGGGRLPRAVRRRLDLAAYRRMDLLVAASEYLADRLLASGIPREAVAVVVPGSDPAEPEGPPRELRRGRRIAVLAVANWLPHKGILELLDAIARLRDEAATLHLAGDTLAASTYGRRVAARIARPDLRDRVVVHGRLAPAGVAALYRAADVFALPSVDEGFATAYAEALRAGLPIVGYRSGNVPRLVRDGAEGLLAAPSDAAAFSEALARLAADEELRERLAGAARRRGATFATWDESAKRFFGLLREAVWPDRVRGRSAPVASGSHSRSGSRR